MIILDRYWLGGKRTGPGRLDFVWIHSGESLVYTNWREPDPNGQNRKEDCMCTAKHINWGWYDTTCYYKYPIICKIAQL